MADWFSASDIDSPAETLGIFTQTSGHWLDPRSFHGKEVLLHHGCPDGAHVGVGSQNRYEMGLTISCVFDLPNKSIKPKADSCGGVLHSLCVFQHSKAFMGILHCFLSWGVDLDGVFG